MKNSDPSNHPHEERRSLQPSSGRTQIPPTILMRNSDPSNHPPEELRSLQPSSRGTQSLHVYMYSRIGHATKFCSMTSGSKFWVLEIVIVFTVATTMRQCKNLQKHPKPPHVTPHPHIIFSCGSCKMSKRT